MNMGYADVAMEVVFLRPTLNQKRCAYFPLTITTKTTLTNRDPMFTVQPTVNCTASFVVVFRILIRFMYVFGSLF